jgi:hypothetical protein
MTTIENTLKVTVNKDQKTVTITGDINISLSLLISKEPRFYKLTSESSLLLNSNANLAQSLHILSEIATQSAYPNNDYSTPE